MYISQVSGERLVLGPCLLINLTNNEQNANKKKERKHSIICFTHLTCFQENSVVTTTTITVTADGRPIEASTEVQVPAGKKSLNKSFSEPALDRHNLGK